jgi:hypothetical protein
MQRRCNGAHACPYPWAAHRYASIPLACPGGMLTERRDACRHGCTCWQHADCPCAVSRDRRMSTRRQYVGIRVCLRMCIRDLWIRDASAVYCRSCMPMQMCADAHMAVVYRHASVPVRMRRRRADTQASTVCQCTRKPVRVCSACADVCALVDSNTRARLSAHVYNIHRS